MRLLRLLLFLIILYALRTSGQCGYPPDPWKTWSDYVRVCQKYGGHIADRRCVDWDTNWCHRNNQPPPLSPEQQEELRQKQQAEAERQAELLRQQEEDRRRRQQEAEAVLEREQQQIEREQQQFISDRDAAAVQLKSSAGSVNAGLKEIGGNTTSFGLKTSTPPDLKTSSTEEARAILRGIQKIQVPPPIPPQEAAIAIGQIAPGDETSKRIFRGLEKGVAVADLVGTIGETTMPWVKLILATGKTVIAVEDAADVYLVKQSGVYDQALKYLKDEKQMIEFTAIVRARKQGLPIPENASIDMVRAADAILDPKLGNSGTRIAWNAMLSSEARRAALTEASIQLAGEALGNVAGTAVENIRAAQNPAFREAEDFLEHAAFAIKQTNDPAAKESLQIAIDQANTVIASTYRAVRPSGQAAEHLTSIYEKEKLEEGATPKR